MNLLDRARTALAMAITPNYVQKASLAGGLMRMFALGNAVWTPKQYDKLAQVGFGCNVIGYKAVSLVSRNFASIPIGLYQKDGDEVEEHPVLDLLRKPNPWQTGKKFKENVCGYFCLSGNAYVEGVDANLDSGDRSSAGPDMSAPKELYTHRPDRITLELSKIGTTQAYIYKANGQERKWKVDAFDGTGPMMHVKTFNPLNDWYGMSPIEAAGWSIDQHNESSVWNKSLLQNGARPSGAMMYKPAGVIGSTLTDDQYKALSAQLDERMSGSGNAARPLILDGGLEWVEMGMTPKDMDWLKGRDNAAREIAMAFGVPAQMLGIPGDNTYANMEEARASFYEETVIPLGESLIESLSSWLLPAYGLEGHELKLELDDISALFPRRKAKWDMVMATKNVLTTNEKRRELGYDELDSPLADELLLEGNPVPLDDLGAQEEQTIEGPDGKVTTTSAKVRPVPGEAEGDPEEVVASLKKAVDRLGNGYAITRRKL